MKNKLLLSELYFENNYKTSCEWACTLACLASESTRNGRQTRAETSATQTTCTLKNFVRFETTSKQAVSKEELKLNGSHPLTTASQHLDLCCSVRTEFHQLCRPLMTPEGSRQNNRKKFFVDNRWGRLQWRPSPREPVSTYNSPVSNRASYVRGDMNIWNGSLARRQQKTVPVPWLEEFEPPPQIQMKFSNI